jgi:glycosyltransferase involved in cell wall biosynthesis
MPDNVAEPEHRPRPLRVLCCSGSLEGGGSERRLWRFVSRLDRQLFLPTLYLLYNRGTFREQLPNDIEVEAFWDRYDEATRYWPGQIHRLQVAHMVEVIKRRDIDVVFDQTFHMTLITYQAALQAGIPRVSVIVSPPSADFERSRERFKFFKKRLLARAYSQPRCMNLAVSEETATDATRYYKIPSSSVLPVPNPIDIAAVRSAASQAAPPAASQAAASRGLRIAVVGRLSPEKGQQLAMEALRIATQASELPITIDFVGDGPDRVSLENMASELALTNRVRFLGFQQNPYPLIQAADLLCIPSLYEGLPNVALEAMALGTSVLATNCCGSLQKLIGNNERGVLVPVKDPMQMSSAFLDRLCHPVEWQTRAESAMQWVELHHAFDPWLAKMQKILLAATKRLPHRSDRELETS